ncbi:MAG: hypothetical protein ACLFPQ_03200 [Candidatus Woesearchaeota archaeon]
MFSRSEQRYDLEELLYEYEFEKENIEIKKEIQGHIHTIKSLSGKRKNNIDEIVEFYVSTDPFEALHMGEYFSSCLSLVKQYGGMNG